MDNPNPSNDYVCGQMMGMLCIIRMLKMKGTISADVIDRIERTASESLAVYLQKPQEDVILLVDNEVKKI